MSETEQAIASLRSSIDSLRAMTLGLQAQAAGKAEASAVATLSARVISCEARIDALGSPVAAQGLAVSVKAPIDAGQILSELTKQITESKLVVDLDSRITEIEKAGLNQEAESRALHDRLHALELSLIALKGQLDASRVSANKT